MVQWVECQPRLWRHKDRGLEGTSCVTESSPLLLKATPSYNLVNKFIKMLLKLVEEFAPLLLLLFQNCTPGDQGSIPCVILSRSFTLSVPHL